MPDNERFLQDIFVPAERSKGAVTGHKVVVELTSYGENGKKPEGKIVERGTFDELMKLDGHFAKVYHTQEAQKASVVDFDHIEGGETLG